MKNKSLKLLIIFITTLIMATSSKVYAKELEKLDAQDIVDYYYYELNENFDKIDESLLITWGDTLENYKGMKNSNMIKLKDEIAGELSRRGVINTNNWKPQIDENSNTRLINITEKILGTIQVVGSAVSVIALVLIGIKYMLSSIEEKAKYKETIMPYIIGCILVFATSNIASIIYNIALNI